MKSNTNCAHGLDEEFFNLLLIFLIKIWAYPSQQNSFLHSGSICAKWRILSDISISKKPCLPSKLE